MRRPELEVDVDAKEETEPAEVYPEVADDSDLFEGVRLRSVLKLSGEESSACKGLS